MNLWQVHTGANFPTDSTHAINSTIWRSTYATLESGKINSQYNLPTLQTVNQRVEAYRQAHPNHNPIMLLEAGYSCLDSNAVRDNLFTVQNGQLRDVANRSRSPYWQRKVRMLATAIGEVKDSTTLIFPSVLSFSNLPLTEQIFSESTITSISIVSGNNAYAFRQATFWNTPLVFSYDRKGIYPITVTVQYNQKPAVKLVCHLTVTQGKLDNINFRTAGGRNDGDSTGNATTQRYENQPLREFQIAGALPLPLPPLMPPIPLGEHYGCRLQIRLSQNNRLAQPDGNVRLRKPLIVVEGYDPHTHNPLIINLSGNTDLFDFLGVNRAGNPVFGGIEWGNQIFPNPFNLNDQLDIADYDLIYVDYNDGTDDITRNAKLFQEVIRWVNARKELVVPFFREENVVLGLSMGGLVARYGLADMEKKRRNGEANNNHEVRMLITHDSPHRGANVPIAMQSLVETFRPVVYAVDILLRPLNIANMIDNRANSQMAIYRTVPIGTLAAGNILYQKNSWLDETYRPMVTFPDNAPAPYQFIALSNGSECGTRLQPPFNHLITNRYAGFIQPIPWLAKAKITTEMMMRGLPDRQVKKIYNLGIYFTLSLFGGWIEIDQDLIAARGFSHADMLPIDGMAGGTQDVGMTDFLRVEGSTDYQTPAWIWFAGFERFNESARNYCFVPKYSALDIRADVPVDEIIANRFHATQVPSRSRADRFFTAPTTPNGFGGGPFTGGEFNQQHLQFTNRNANFIFSQMEPGRAAATLPIMDCYNALCEPTVMTMNGISNLCFGGQAGVYEIKALPQPAVVAWSASNNLVTLSPATNPNAITINASSAAARGFVTITAVVTSAACNAFRRTITRRIWVGEPRTLGLQTRVEGCYMVITPVSPGATDFDWELSHPDIAIADYGTNSIAIHYADWVALNLTQITVTCRASNACNPNTPLETVETFSRPAFPLCPLRIGTPTKPVETIKTYPNPTAGTTYITLPEGSSAVQAISVRNSLGVEVLNLQQPTLNENKELVLNLGSLPDGLYVVGLQQIDGSVQYVKVVVQKGGKAN